MALKAGGLAAACLALSPLAAAAGGLERNIPSVAILFEEGRYLEFGASYVSPDLDGDGGVIPGAFIGSPTDVPISGNTGDLLEGYASFGAAFKGEIGERFSYALILDQPLGAATEYPTGTTAFPSATAVYGGSSADLESYRLTGIVAFDPAPGFKVYGGPMVQAIRADAAISFLEYEVETDTAWGVGFMGGAAYERPEIGLRVALTYRSRISHDFDTTETIGAATVDSETGIETPQSLTLDAQTGIAPGTLVFGQVHWVDWSAFEIAPPNYPLLASAGRPLVDYEEDWISYTLGIGRQFTERWSGALSATWEPQTETELTSLGPVDGRIGLTAGATYETDRIKLTGGVTYSWLGDAENVLVTDYDGGRAIGVGLRIGFKL